MMVGLLGVMLTLGGCGTPSYTSAMRTNFVEGTPLELECVRYLDRRAGDLREKAEELYEEGWRLAYMSEYTSSKKSKFALLACFERPRGQ
jgi:hypothetical protein